MIASIENSHPPLDTPITTSRLSQADDILYQLFKEPTKPLILNRKNGATVGVEFICQVAAKGVPDLSVLIRGRDCDGSLNLALADFLTKTRSRVLIIELHNGSKDAPTLLCRQWKPAAVDIPIDVLITETAPM